MDKKSKIFLAVFFLLIIVSVGVTFWRIYIKKDYKYITERIKAQIARNFWKNEGWYPVILQTDIQFAKALTLFNEAKLLAKLK